MNEKQLEERERRLVEIRERWSKVRYECGEADENAYADDVGHLLSLLQQPTSERCGECQLCGHEKKWLANDDTCHFPVPICADDYHGTRFCGCKCVFPSTGTEAPMTHQEAKTVIEGPSSTEYDTWLKTRPDLLGRFKTNEFTVGSGYEIWRNAWLRLREMVYAALPPSGALSGNERGVLNVLAGTYHRDRHEGDMMVCPRWPCDILVNAIREREVATTGAGERQKTITYTALIEVLQRLRSKNRNPNREWYNGWNAAIDCLIHDAEAAAAPAIVAEEPQRDVWDLLNKRRHELIHLKRDQGFLEDRDEADYNALQHVAGLVRELLTPPLPANLAATVVEGEALTERFAACNGWPCTLPTHNHPAPTPVQPEITRLAETSRPLDADIQAALNEDFGEVYEGVQPPDAPQSWATPHIIHEDELSANISKEDYDTWYLLSWIQDGVRVGPRPPSTTTPGEGARERAKEIVLSADYGEAAFRAAIGNRSFDNLVEAVAAALLPTDATQVAVEAAEVAREIVSNVTHTEVDWAYLTITSDPEFEAGKTALAKIAAIVSKHCAADTGEVRARAQLEGTLNCLAQSQQEVERLRDELSTARANAIGECANLARVMAAGETYETGRQKAFNIAAALESLRGRRWANRTKLKL